LFNNFYDIIKSPSEGSSGNVFTNTEKRPETKKGDERDFACIYHTCVNVRVIGRK
jgi:hypothetical protein